MERLVREIIETMITMKERNIIMISEREREIITHVTAKKRKVWQKLCDTSDE
jgi:hypothetical protein